MSTWSTILEVLASPFYFKLYARIFYIQTAYIAPYNGDN
jgi:hypothetical protein